MKKQKSSKGAVIADLKNQGWSLRSSAATNKIIAAAKDHVGTRKEARTNIRLGAADMIAIKQRADVRGLGYQTLIASVIHMYVNDELLEVQEVAKLAKMGLLKAQLR